jgi:GNAT superfamily N-acetyltransferase
MFTPRIIANAFIKGWVRSRSGPNTTLSRLGPLKHIRFDRPLGTPPLNDEFFAFRLEPDEVVKLIQARYPNLPHWLTVLDSASAESQAAYEAHGYALRALEYLMVRSLNKPPFTNGAPTTTNHVLVRRVETAGEADWFNAAKGSETVSEAKLLDPSINFYYIEIGEYIVARGRAILVDGRFVVIDDVFTHPDYRRRGLATALMVQMLTDALQAGARQSVLAASQAGRQLYQKLGYQDVAPLLVFISA